MRNIKSIEFLFIFYLFFLKIYPLQKKNLRSPSDHFSLSQQGNSKINEWMNQLRHKALNEATLKGTNEIIEIFRRIIKTSHHNKAFLQSSIKTITSQKQYLSHPLTPYIFQSIIQSKFAHKQLREEASNYLMSLDTPLSCPQKTHLFKIYDNFRTTNIRKIFNKTLTSNDNKFKKNFLTRFIHTLDKNPSIKQAPYKIVYNKLFPESQKRKNWKHQWKRFIRQKKCKEARNYLISIKNKVFFYKNKYIIKTNSCFINKNEINTHVYFIDKNLKKNPSHKIYWAFKLSELQRLIQRRQDKKVLKKLYQLLAWSLFQPSVPHKYQANTLHLLVTMLERNNKNNEAMQIHREIIYHYFDTDYFETSLKKFIFYYAQHKRWNQLILTLEQVLENQVGSSDKVFRRDSSTFGLAYYWLGHAHQKSNNLQLAIKTWKRLASEFFSTFYGSLGHYLVEKTTKKQYNAYPYPPISFNFDDFYDHFNDRDKYLLKRISWLLEFNKKKEALCELKELSANDHRYSQKTFKSLVYYMTGNWLQAIKNFVKIPRHIRFSMPFGFEKLLFPRKFDRLINKFSLRAGLDAALISALVRQESVFDIQARSPANARGLMQLLISTAKHESRKLSSSYLPYPEQQHLRSLLRSNRNLYNPKVNLTLGIHYLKRLLKRFSQPVLSLAAYNAGPTRVKKWLKEISQDNWLIFIEKIPFKETRKYVKLVLRNYFYYKKWYAHSSARLPYFDQLRL